MAHDVRLGFDYSPVNNQSITRGIIDYVVFSDDTGPYLLQQTTIDPKTYVTDKNDIVRNITLNLAVRGVTVGNTAKQNADEAMQHIRTLKRMLNKTEYFYDKFGSLRPNQIRNDGMDGQALVLTLHPHNSSEKRYYDVVGGDIVTPTKIMDYLSGTPIKDVVVKLIVKEKSKGEIMEFYPCIDYGDLAFPFDLFDTSLGHGWSTTASSGNGNIFLSTEDNLKYGFRYGDSQKLVVNGNGIATHYIYTNETTVSTPINVHARISARFTTFGNNGVSLYVQAYRVATSAWENIAVVLDPSVSPESAYKLWADFVTPAIEISSLFNKIRLALEVTSNANNTELNGFGLYTLPANTTYPEVPFTEFLAVNRKFGDAYFTMYNCRGDENAPFYLRLTSKSTSLFKGVFIGGKFTAYQHEKAFYKLSARASLGANSVTGNRDGTNFWYMKPSSIQNTGGATSTSFSLEGNFSTQPNYQKGYTGHPNVYRGFLTFAANQLAGITSVEVTISGIKKIFKSKKGVWPSTYTSTGVGTQTLPGNAVTDMSFWDIGDWKMRNSGTQTVEVGATINGTIVFNHTNNTSTVVSTAGLLLIPVEQALAVDIGYQGASGTTLHIFTWGDRPYIAVGSSVGAYSDLLNTSNTAEVGGGELAFVPSSQVENSGTRFDIVPFINRGVGYPERFYYDASQSFDMYISYRPISGLGI